MAPSPCRISGVSRHVAPRSSLTYIPAGVPTYYLRRMTGCPDSSNSRDIESLNADYPCGRRHPVSPLCPTPSIRTHVSEFSGSTFKSVIGNRCVSENIFLRSSSSNISASSDHAAQSTTGFNCRRIGDHVLPSSSLTLISIPDTSPLGIRTARNRRFSTVRSTRSHTGLPGKGSTSENPRVRLIRGGIRHSESVSSFE